MELQSRRTTQVSLCYAQSDGYSNDVETVRRGLTNARIRFVDIHDDGPGGGLEVDQVVKMMKNAVWTVLVMTPALLHCEYILAVLAEISKTKSFRDIIILGRTNIIELVPVWLLPLSVMTLILNENEIEWVKGVTNAIRKSPKMIDSFDGCPNFSKSDLWNEKTGQSPSYFSDPNPVSSEEEEEATTRSRYLRPHRNRKMYLRYRRALAKPYRNQATEFPFRVTRGDLTSVLQDWAWKIALFNNSVDEDANRHGYKFCVNIDSIRVKSVKFSMVNQIIKYRPLSQFFKTNFNNVNCDHTVRTMKTIVNEAQVNVHKGMLDPGLKIEPPASVAAETTFFKKGIGLSIDSLTDKKIAREFHCEYRYDQTFSVPGFHTHQCTLTKMERTSSWKFTAACEASGNAEVSICDQRGNMLISVKTPIAAFLDKNRNQEWDHILMEDNKISWLVRGTADFRYSLGVLVDLMKIGVRQ